jgi:hemerythrin-like domain-containing protein
MLYEHDLGRRLLRDMEESLHKINKDPEAKKDLIVTSLNYIELLRQHIFKEDNILFKMAEEVLDDDIDKRLVKAFEDVETRVLGSEVHERLIRSLDEIEKLLK